MKTLVAFVVCFLFTSLSAAEFQYRIDPNILDYKIQPLKIPYVTGDTAHFAYVQESGVMQYLKLAQITSTYPTPKAENLSTLASYDTTDVYPGVVERIVDLSASPDNRYLLVYSLQEGYFPSEGFFDHNIRIYDMATGDLIGFTNEHSFAGIDRSNAYSSTFEDYIVAIGASPEESANWTYAVGTEGVIVNSPEWQWNEDGTLTIAFNLEVFESFDGGSYLAYIGVDEFYNTFSISPTGLSSQGYGPPPAAATYPSLFSLTPVGGAAEKIKFRGQEVKFPLVFNLRYRKPKYFETSKIATMVEGSIPRRYRYWVQTWPGF